jgi:putative ABC transport system permease protein
MNLINSFRTAYRGIKANKLRSFLTMLGIMIGVLAVVTLISLGTGASDSATSSIRGLGSNLLIISPGNAGNGSMGARQAAGSITSLTNDDAQAIKDGVSAVKKVSPEFSSQAQVVFQNQSTNSSISGVTPEYESVHNFHSEYGSFISSTDQSSQGRVVVLGQNVAAALFGQANPLGKIIKIKNTPFTVIGIMQKKGQSGFQNLDDMVFIPLSTAQKRLFGENYLRSVFVQVDKESEVDQASFEIKALLMNRHNISDPADADFTVTSQADILSAVNQITGIMTALLGGIAAISLLVGGIGIMNIMLVSVTERTREIGLRKAVGAKKRDILAQFLIESVLLSVFGGIIGLAFGIGLSYMISKIGGFSTVVTTSSILLAFFFSAGIGIFFGVYPASRAAKLSPIEALRFE